MPSWKTPTPEQVERAIALLGHPEHQARFFGRLENPLWIAPLHKHGFFKHPPGQDGTPSFAPWAASAYLARMAAHAPEEVLAILLRMPQSGNVQVRQDILDAALVLPATSAARLVTQNMSWLKESGLLPLQLPEKLAALAVHLAEGGEVTAAWLVARPLLRVERDKTMPALPPEVAAYGISPPVVPHARFDTWHYGRLVEREVAALVKASGKRGLVELVTLLGEAIARATDHGPVPEDHLQVGRPAIENHKQNSPAGFNGPVDALIDAVRDAAIQLIGDSAISIDEVIALLDKQRWRVFQRVALHVLRRWSPQAQSLIAMHLADPELYASPAVFHEHVLLARTTFASLTPEAQEAILRLGDNDTDKYRRARVFGAFVEEISPPVAERHPWLASLSTEGGMATETGTDAFPQDRDFLVSTHSWIGPKSPRTLEDLRRLTVDQIVMEIKTWAPEGALWSPSPEGFARILGVLVRERPSQFAREAERFIGLPTPYVGHMLLNLAEAVRAKVSLSWEPMLKLCAWVMDQTREVSSSGTTSGSNGEAENDQSLAADSEIQPSAVDVTPKVGQTGAESDDWEWARSNVARLIEAGMATEDLVVAIPFDLYRNALHLLVALAEDRHPTPEEDREFADTEDGRPKMGPSGLALNSVRGAAFHALLHFALQLRRQVDELTRNMRASNLLPLHTAHAGPDDSEANTSEEAHDQAIELLQHVLAVLDGHLDPSIDPSLAVRSVYGRFFPWLVMVDRDWTAARVGRIFPVAHQQRKLHAAAWETYLTFCQPYREVYLLLASEYRRAVEGLQADSNDGTNASEQQIAPTPGWRLGEHLIILYLQGVLALDMGKDQVAANTFEANDSRLLADFFARAPEPIRAHAIEYAGLVFQHSEGELPVDVQDRAERLWEVRVAAITGDPESHRQELAAFGDWYGSGKLNRTWALEQVREALRLSGGAMRSPHLVADRLVQDIESFGTDEQILLSVECLSELCFGPHGRLAIVNLVEPQMRQILAAGHAAQAERTRQTADALINRLGEYGFLEFGNILKGE